MSAVHHTYKPVSDQAIDIHDDSTDELHHVELEDQKSRMLSRRDLFRLTISMGGLQVVWATVMSEGSPFLLSLRLKPQVVSLVWLAGPVCGTLFQPYIGYKSDSCTHRWGRRKPFVIFGTMASIVCINNLAWISESTTLICNMFGIHAEHDFPRFLTKSFAVVLVWALNLALQPVQAGLRALIIDSCPHSQQVQASAFASRAVIVGSAFGYGCGFLDMPKATWVNNTQFKGVCLLASALLAFTVAITCMMAKDSRASSDSSPLSHFGFRHVIFEIYKTMRTLPRNIRYVCMVQFFAWMAWFPFLFHMVTYLSKLYEAQILSARMGPPSVRFYNALRQQSVRHGVLAMLLFSVVALLANFTMSYLIPTQSVAPTVSNLQNSEKADIRPDTLSPSRRTGRSTIRSMIVAWVTIQRAWMCSHILTSICLLGATFEDEFMSSVFFVALLGVSWALTQWIPFAIISAELAAAGYNDRGNFGDTTTLTSSGSSREQLASLMQESSGSYHHEEESQIMMGDRPAATAATRRPSTRMSSRTATTMGVHNIAVAVPQIISALLGSLIFWLFRSLHLGDTEAFAWVLRVGVLAGVCAAYLTGGI